MSHRLVVIGASLGGVRALRIALGPLSPRIPVPVLFVQHRRGGFEDRLPALLEEHIALPIREVESHQDLVPGNLFIAPPDYHVLLDGNRVELSMEEPVHHARPSLDVTFESAAEAYGSGLLAILLTSATEDGADGLALARQAGALTIVQDPETAESDVAPRAALDRDGEHRVLRPDEMAKVIEAWARSGHPS